nr:hypothetical protein [Donax trunculus]
MVGAVIDFLSSNPYWPSVGVGSTCNSLDLSCFRSGESYLIPKNSSFSAFKHLAESGDPSLCSALMTVKLTFTQWASLFMSSTPASVKLVDLMAGDHSGYAVLSSLKVASYSGGGKTLTFFQFLVSLELGLYGEMGQHVLFKSFYFPDCLAAEAMETYSSVSLHKISLSADLGAVNSVVDAVTLQGPQLSSKSGEAVSVMSSSESYMTDAKEVLIEQLKVSSSNQSPTLKKIYKCYGESQVNRKYATQLNLGNEGKVNALKIKLKELILEGEAKKTALGKSQEGLLSLMQRLSEGKKDAFILKKTRESLETTCKIMLKVVSKNS